jgi:hypothetical protein
VFTPPPHTHTCISSNTPNTHKSNCTSSPTRAPARSGWRHPRGCTQTDWCGTARWSRWRCQRRTAWWRPGHPPCTPAHAHMTDGDTQGTCLQACGREGAWVGTATVRGKPCSEVHNTHTSVGTKRPLEAVVRTTAPRRAAPLPDARSTPPVCPRRCPDPGPRTTGHRHDSTRGSAGFSTKAPQPPAYSTHSAAGVTRSAATVATEQKRCTEGTERHSRSKGLMTGDHLPARERRCARCAASQPPAGRPPRRSLPAQPKPHTKHRLQRHRPGVAVRFGDGGNERSTGGCVP